MIVRHFEIKTRKETIDFLFNSFEETFPILTYFFSQRAITYDLKNVLIREAGAAVHSMPLLALVPLMVS